MDVRRKRKPTAKLKLEKDAARNTAIFPRRRHLQRSKKLAGRRQSRDKAHTFRGFTTISKSSAVQPKFHNGKLQAALLGHLNA